MSETDALREQVRGLDARILELIAERMALVKRIGEGKKAAGVPLRDWEVERQVLSAARSTAQRVGLSPQLARSVMQLLIGESRAEQERQTWSSYSGDAEQILIVGGLGRMGRWFSEFFLNQGHTVSIHDTRSAAARGENGGAKLAELAGRASLVFVAVPLEKTAAAIDEVVAAGYRGVVCDVASLKSSLRPAMERARAAGAAVTSIHPMFGPSASTLSDKVICICDCGDAAATARVEALFRDTAATLVRLSIDEHDRIAAYVLGLSHLINVVFMRVLAESGLSFEQLRSVGSTTFLSQMNTTGTVIREDPRLYYAIQKLNPFTPGLYESLRAAVEGLTGSVLAGDLAGFAAAMTGGVEWMGDHDAH